MPYKRIIHTQDDTQSVLKFADSIGLLLLPRDLDDDDPRSRTPEELRSFSRGEILLFQPEWVVDGIQLTHIETGVDAGTYCVRSGTNMSPISLDVSGEKDIAGVRRLGIGHVSFKREWLHHAAHEMRPAPPEVEQVYKQVCKHLFSPVHARGGGHRYYVCKHAAEVAARSPTLPPYDYIPWPPPDLQKKSVR